MRILVIGNGAREDALSWRLASSPSCEAIFASPGNAGTASRGENWNISATDGPALLARAQQENIDLLIVGPETSIAAGVCDRFRAAGIAVFGPSRKCGRLETSKIFAKKFLENHRIPTARGVAVHSLDAARKALEKWDGGVVVKADGLAAGKGVVVCDDVNAARDILTQWFTSEKIPGGGNSVLLEERLSGRELSVFAIGDGKRFVPFASACDYKRAGDGDTGPNTGGMGAYSPPIGFPIDFTETVFRDILEPVLAGLLDDGDPYIGMLYCGLMWTDAGPKVIEFNVRFGDPETQAMMPLVDGDFAAFLLSAAQGNADPKLATIRAEACTAVVLASHRYPLVSTAVSGLSADVALPHAVAFWGGSERVGDVVNATGGRVLTVAATGDTIDTARARTYAGIAQLAERFGSQELSYRTDIAANLTALL